MRVNKDDIKENVHKAIEAVKCLLNDKFKIDASKADKLSYWFREYVSYIKKERDFDYTRLQNYKRGDILKVNFGFRIGSELGGLHYCVVIDNRTYQKSTTLTVVPLTSLKERTDISKLPKTSVFLGSDFYDKVSEKLNDSTQKLKKTLDIAKKAIENGDSHQKQEEKVHNVEKQLQHTQRLINDFEKMKTGSIAQVGQITTVSKMRIYDPKRAYSSLHGIRLSENNLDLINKKIKELYIHEKN